MSPNKPLSSQHPETESWAREVKAARKKSPSSFPASLSEAWIPNGLGHLRMGEKKWLLSLGIRIGLLAGPPAPAILGLC